MRYRAGMLDDPQIGQDDRRRARPAAHELERYERLFAARTRQMRSSAMRDMMALTERPEVISLAGGLPDTSTFAPELFAKLMSHVAAESTARALQYGPTEGMASAMECIVEVMAAEGTVVDPGDLIVTTGGQQVIDLVCKTLIDPGDVIVAEAPTYPGAVPTFGAYQAEVVQIEMDADGMPIERELLILEDNPYGLLRYEGEPLPTLYSLDASHAGRGGASDLVIYLGTFSKILSPGLRLGWAVAPRPVLEKLNLGKQGADLCSSPVTQLFVSAYFRERDATGGAGWREYVETLKGIYRRRRDVMLAALEEHLGEGASWTRPQGGMFIWATLPEHIDTTDLLARCEGVAFVPGRAAYMDAHRGASSMRLNFAGVPDADIRDGVERIGEGVRKQAGLFGTLVGSPPAQPSAGARAATAKDDPKLAEIVQLPRLHADDQARQQNR